MRPGATVARGLEAVGGDEVAVVDVGAAAGRGEGEGGGGGQKSGGKKSNVHTISIAQNLWENRMFFVVVVACFAALLCSSTKLCCQNFEVTNRSCRFFLPPPVAENAVVQLSFSPRGERAYPTNTHKA